MLGGAMTGPGNPDPPGPDPDFTVCYLGTDIQGGLRYPVHAVRVNFVLFTLEMPVFLPVPEGATGISSISLDTQAVAVGGGAATLVLQYDPLNGGPTAGVPRAVGAPDPGWVTMSLGPGLAPPTPGHFVKVEYRVLTSGGGNPITVQYTRMVVGWT
jgi:hypothetical protein